MLVVVALLQLALFSAVCQSTIVCFPDQARLPITCNSCPTPFPIDNFSSQTTTVRYGSEDTLGFDLGTDQDNTDACKATCLGRLECVGIKPISFDPYNCQLLLGTGHLEVTGAYARQANRVVNFTVECPGITNLHLDPSIELRGASLLSVTLLNTSHLSTCAQPTRLVVSVQTTAVAAFHGPVYGRLIRLNVGFVEPALDVTALVLTISIWTMIAGAMLTGMCSSRRRKIK